MKAQFAGKGVNQYGFRCISGWDTFFKGYGDG